MFNIALITVFVALIIFYIKNVYSYWKKRDVLQLSPTFPFGNVGKALTFHKSLCETLQELYKQTTAPICGIYIMTKPTLLVRDPKLIQQILIKDFQHFHDRGTHSNIEYDPFSGHLFSLAGEKWKNLRARLTPTFTSGKLKLMFHTITDCGLNLENYLKNFIVTNDVIEIKEILQRFTTDIIGSVAFGLDVDSINDPNTMFRQVGSRISGTGLRMGIKNTVKLLLPRLMKFFNMKTVDPDIEEYLLDIITSTIKHRELNNIQRKDFLQLLIQLRNTGKVNLDGDWDISATITEKGKMLTIPEMAAQVYIFFLAGFETSAAAMSFCIYELAKNEELQIRVRKEIKEVMARNDNKLTYESLTEMKYLESCVDETLRKYPSLAFLNRICTKPIKLDNVFVEKNTTILIPVLAIHRDEQYYPDPMKFNPDRFYGKETEKQPFIYMPFGDGPHICIGLRLGKMTTKVGLCSMLANYHYTLSCNMKEEVEMHATTVILSPVGGITLNIKQI